MTFLNPVPLWIFAHAWRARCGLCYILFSWCNGDMACISAEVLFSESLFAEYEEVGVGGDGGGEAGAAAVDFAVLRVDVDVLVG